MNCINSIEISKNFGSVQALKNINISFSKGKITGLIGRNGAGKTTLLNIISSRIKASKGSIVIDNEPAFEKDAVMKKVYYMSVSNFFPIDMKVNEAIKVCSNLVETFNKEEALRYLNLFNVPLKRKISKLSTGTQSLFKLSIALASNSEYLLFDEPILGLDANNRELFYRLLLEKQVENECGVILSTHLISEVSNIIEDVCAINNGEIIMMGNVEEILSNYYILSGPQETVDEVSKDLEIISKKHLSGLATYGIKGTPPSKELPLGLSISSYNLQQLFIDITGEPVEERTI